MILNNNVQIPNQSSFKADIKISRKAYNALPFKDLEVAEKYIGYPWEIKDSKFLDEGFSDGTTVCTMGFIKTKGAKKGYMFHLHPKNPENDFIEVEKDIKKAIFKMKLRSWLQFKKPKLEGFLMGANIDDGKSAKQADKLMNLFDKKKIQYTALLGQRILEGAVGYFYPKSNMYVSAPKDKYILDFTSVGYCKKQEDLGNFFKIVKKAPQDNFIFEE